MATAKDTTIQATLEWRGVARQISVAVAVADEHECKRGLCVSWPYHLKRPRHNYSDARVAGYPDPRIVPPPPDYSTPAAVRARCLEGGTIEARKWADDTRDAGMRKAYKELRAVVPAMPCPVADTHESKWAIVKCPGEYARVWRHGDGTSKTAVCGDTTLHTEHLTLVAK